MHSDSVCRLCLAVEADNKMLSLTPVQELYEKVTNNRLYTNKMPVTVCFICFAQLKKCYKFMVKSTVAEKMLIKILNTQTEITPESVRTINRDAKGLKNPLTVRMVKHENFPFEFNVPAVVKSELIEQEEIDIDGEDIGSLNTANIPESTCDAQVSPPLKGDVGIEKGYHKGISNRTENFEDKTTAMKRMQSLEPIVIENSEHYLCRFCETLFVNHKDIMKHLREHKPYVCAVYQLPFENPFYLRRHTKVHSGERSHACNLHDKRFLTTTHLKQHLLSHSGEKLYECDICNSKFTLKVNLIKHIKKHTGERCYECDVCHLKFTEKFNMKVHLKLHSSEKPFQCHYCGKEFITKLLIANHIIQNHHDGVASKPRHNREKEKGKTVSIHSSSPAPAYECNICFRKFNFKSNMKRHLLIHDKPYQCSFCDRSYSQSAALVVHTRTHTGEKAYECETCSRTFEIKSKLIEHLRTHTGEKPFKCKVCNRSFSKKYHLVRHVRLHTGEKPFECKICNRCFCEKSTLVRHVRTHTGEKPFECKICNRSFRQNSTLVGHVRTHTGEKPFECKICSLSFRQKNHLVRHVGTAHRRETI